MKFKVGNWVVVTKRRFDGPDIELRGKIVEATPDYAVAECRTFVDGIRKPVRFTMSEDTASIIFFRRATQRDFNRRGY